jgi:hypothetical protein
MAIQIKCYYYFLLSFSLKIDFYKKKSVFGISRRPKIIFFLYIFFSDYDRKSNSLSNSTLVDEFANKMVPESQKKWKFEKIKSLIFKL